MEKMRAMLPIGATFSARVLETLRDESMAPELSPRVAVMAVYYAGDEGGIVCTLETEPLDAKKVRITSITHLIFDRRHPLSREIRAYQKHRIKRLRKLGGGRP